jgi:hypothetical protein
MNKVIYLLYTNNKVILTIIYKQSNSTILQENQYIIFIKIKKLK